MASRGGHSGIGDSFRNGTKRHDSNKENTSQQGVNSFRMQKERQSELSRPGRVFNRNISRGGYSRSQHRFTQEFRIVKDNRSKQKEAVETLPEAFHNRDSSNEHSVSDVGDKSSTEILAAQDHLVTPNVNGHGAAQADKGIKSAAQASSVRKLEQSEGMQSTLVGSHAVSGKSSKNRVATPPSGKNNFGAELCCSSSDPIHVPSPGSKSAGTFGAIKREVGVVGARQRPSDSPATNTSTSNSLAKVTSAQKDILLNEQQSGLPGASLRNGRLNSPVPLSGRASHHVSHTKVSSHLEWKPKSISPSCVNHEVSVVPPSVDCNQADLAGLSKKLSQANASQDEHVIIPEHIRVPDSERTHLIFGTFEPEIDPKASVAASHTVVTAEDLNEHSPPSQTALNSITATDVAPNDKMDHLGSCSPLPEPESIISVSEHQQSLTESVEAPSPGVVNEYGTNEMITRKVAYSQPQFQHQDTPANFKSYEPDSRYVMPFITKFVDGQTAQSPAYTSEAMGLHPANAYQLPASGVAQQPVPQMYPQQFPVPQYPNIMPYRNVYSAQYGSPMVAPNYSSNPAFPQLPHASSYLVMPNGAPQLAVNGMKYGSSHQYKPVFQGTPAGYGGYASHNGYPVSNGVIGSTGAIEDGNMNKYKDNSLYAPNPQAEAADVWVQGQREIPSMPPAQLYNIVGQPVSPHAAYISPHNGHPSFSPAPPHPAHLQYPGFPPHALHPTSMTMVQNPQAMVHQPGAPGNLGLDMAAMGPGSQVGAFQQNQLGHLGWAPQSF